MKKMNKNPINMIDISDKKFTRRVAQASVCVVAPCGVIRKIKNKTLPKGDCLNAARVAGILAAKSTASIIPLCHPLPITHVDIKFVFSAKRVMINSVVKADYATGVEMEALTACAVAALTIYDMAKTEDKGIVITDLKLVRKSGGKSGNYRAVG
jgi:cyclic pyranopterin phosphate synthase